MQCVRVTLCTGHTGPGDDPACLCSRSCRLALERHIGGASDPDDGYYSRAHILPISGACKTSRKSKWTVVDVLAVGDIHLHHCLGDLAAVMASGGIDRYNTKGSHIAGGP